MDTVATQDALIRSPHDAWRTFDRWSSNLFLVLAVLSFVVALWVTGLAGGTYPLFVRVSTLGIVVIGSAVLYSASAGFDRERKWARPTAWALLLILVVTGLLAALVDFTHGKLTIPLGSIVAAVVLSKRPGSLPAIAGRDRRIGIGMAAVFAATSLGGGAPAWLTTAPESPFVVASDALDLRISVACPTADAQRIPVAASWTWRERDAFAFGTDGVLVAWLASGGDDEDGDGGTFRPDAITTTGPLFYGGGWLTATAIQDAADGADQGVEQGIDVDAGGLTDSSVTFDLIPFDATGTGPAHGWLRVWAVYAHLDRWTVRQETTCEW